MHVILQCFTGTEEHKQLVFLLLFSNLPRNIMYSVILTSKYHMVIPPRRQLMCKIQLKHGVKFHGFL